MSESFDLVIVGGGVNGAALARLAGFNQLRTLLLDKGDFGGETSSNSSKLIHGGLRYLETFDFGLVQEALEEREKLLEIANHLVEPLHLHLPITTQSKRGKFLTKLGLSLYDLFAGSKSHRGHYWVGKGSHSPDAKYLDTSKVTGIFAYPDCMVDDARMVLELILDAEKLGVQVENYWEFLGVEEDTSRGKEVYEITYLNKITGVEKEIYATHVAFCLGPWNDLVCLSEFSKGKKTLARSQGIHLYYENLPLKSSYLLPVPNTPRYFFILPWKRGHLVGTTETTVSDSHPGPFTANEVEIQEIEKLLNYYFPEIKATYTTTTTGVRPLALGKSKNLSKVSRKPAFHKMYDRIYAGVGGKYTTHAPFAEELLKKIFQKERAFKPLGKRHYPGAFTSTKQEVLDQIEQLGFSEENLRVLWVERYGQRALEVAHYVLSSPGGKELLSSKYHLHKGEVLFSIHKEKAKTPTDFFRRRTSLYFTEQGGLDLYQEVKKIFEKEIPETRHLESKNSYLDFLKRNRHRCMGEF